MPVKGRFSAPRWAQVMTVWKRNAPLRRLGRKWETVKRKVVSEMTDFV
jgi:hypothetical protein